MVQSTQRSCVCNPRLWWARVPKSGWSFLGAMLLVAGIRMPVGASVSSSAITAIEPSRLDQPVRLEPSDESAPRLITQFYGTLQRGDQGDAVESLQRALGRNGLLETNQFNGIYGPATEQAVRTFQRIREMPVTGVANPATLDALNVDISRFGPTLEHPDYGTLSTDRLTFGDQGTDVRALQRALRATGFSVGVDGDYGSQTQQAVRTYQRVRGLPVTGTADYETLYGLGFRDAFSDGGGGRPNLSENGTAASAPYVATIIGRNQEFAFIRSIYPNAQLASTRRGDIIVLGRFSNRDNAETLAEDAVQRGFDARVLHGREL